MKKQKFLSLAHFVLEILHDAGEITSAMLLNTGTGPMGAFPTCRHYDRPPTRASFSVLLSRLKADGLIKRSGAKKFARWSMTSEGRKQLRAYRALFRERQQTIGLPPLFEKPKPDGIIRIVSFDVPEKERRKRQWLRSSLYALDYKLLHKSVWIGTTPLPEDFFNELKIMNMLKYVHVVSVTKKGTLEGA